MNTARVVNHQIQMFRAVTEGTELPYSPAYLEQLHEHLHISDEHFSKLLRIILDVYVYYEVPAEKSAEILAALETFRPLLVKEDL